MENTVAGNETNTKQSLCLSIEKEVDGKKYRFVMDQPLDLGVAYSFAFGVLTELLKLSNEHLEKAKIQDKKEDKKEEVKKDENKK